jgi:hypothetical protein
VTNQQKEKTVLEAKRLLNVLTSDDLMALEKAESVTHALVDIAESIAEVYEVLLPKLMSLEQSSKSARQEVLWEIREEFRHIEYHLNDAGLGDI